MDDEGHAPEEGDGPTGTTNRTTRSGARPDGEAGERVGHFTIRRLIGAGGMGQVYEAVQDSPRRRVALKLLGGALVGSDAARRFQYECRVLARLQHPFIAQIYESGVRVAPFGPQPYFAMEYVSGARTLTEHAHAERLPLAARLHLFVKICDAVHHAHQRGVIHRDLKPSNILVDENGVPKIIDFGLARAASASDVDYSMLTQTGVLLGTPAYMSPEQACGDPRGIDVRSDVYTLGVVLYELVAGKLPYDVGGATPVEAARIIRDAPPRRLSAVSGDRSLRGDLETIVRKALEKDTERRYQSARELADDLRHHLAGEPIAARSPSLAYQVRVFARRHKGLVFGTAAVVVALAIGLVGTMLQARRARAAERAVRASLVETRRQMREAALSAYAARIAAASAALERRDVVRAREQLRLAPTELRGWEWRYLASRLDRSERVLFGHANSVLDVAISPDGRRIASLDRLRLLVWDAGGGPPRAMEGRVLGGSNGRLAWDRTGRRLAAPLPGGVGIWDAGSGRLLRRCRLPGTAASLDWSKETGEIYVLGRRSLFVFDETGARRREIDLGLPDWAAERVVAGPTGRLVLVATGKTLLALRPAASGAVLWRAQIPLALGLAISSDGRRVAAASFFATKLSLLDARTGAVSREIPLPFGSSSALAFDGEGRRLFAATGAELALFDAATGEHIGSWAGHTGNIGAIAAARVGGLVVTGGEDGTLRMWRAGPGSAGPDRGATVRRACFGTILPGGRGILCRRRTSKGTRIAVYDLDAGEERWSWVRPEARLAKALPTVGRRGLWFALLLSSGAIEIDRVSDGEPLATLPPVGSPGELTRCVLAERLGRFACGFRDGTIRVWELPSGRPLGTFARHPAPVTALVIDDGGRIVSGDAGGRLCFTDREDACTREPGGIAALALAGTEPWVVVLAEGSAGREASVLSIWSARTQARERQAFLDRSISAFAGIAADPTGRTLALFGTGPDPALLSRESAGHLCDLKSGLPLLIESMQFTEDGASLIATNVTGHVREWRVSSLRARALPLVDSDSTNARIERELDRRGSGEEAVAAIRDDPSLDEAERRAALETLVARLVRIPDVAKRVRFLTTGAEPSAEQSAGALAFARELVRLAPDDPLTRDALARAEYRAGEPKAALAAMPPAQAPDSCTDRELEAFRAMALARVGLRAGAREALARATGGKGEGCTGSRPLFEEAAAVVGAAGEEGTVPQPAP